MLINPFFIIHQLYSWDLVFSHRPVKGGTQLCLSTFLTIREV